MKVFTTILFMALAFLTTSCGGDDEDPIDKQNEITEPFFVKIDGQAFVPVQIDAALVANATIVIEAVNAQGKDIIIGFPSTAKPGVELKAGLIGTNGVDIFVPIYDTENGFFATNGTLTVASHDMTTNKISGRFSFSGDDPNDASKTLNFTEGEFIVTYTE